MAVPLARINCMLKIEAFTDGVSLDHFVAHVACLRLLIETHYPKSITASQQSGKNRVIRSFIARQTSHNNNKDEIRRSEQACIRLTVRQSLNDTAKGKSKQCQ
ncbi:uncharacterized protein EURHEDRAFT_75563 [Aspergillus ruber CBS 135680]|uniref:Uncharacterized protein n=1 Tax=Aspergillus ruber (strain CBS 135680) TaxID=1388766 RepID=A0A017SDU7_ASPRC|nr:uncharacterized protein EURHEDRAFT_75563 [Aspergillus ruber CBS 135680]EYE94956.1 hypothetical protein EURHEDRAFT_75563 [Aspergillus ruber CBS 135680]